MRRFKRKSYSCAFFVFGEGLLSFSVFILEARKMYITKHFRMVSHARDPTDISWKQLISTINTGLKENISHKLKDL
jgi:hypothetical protein